MVGLIDTWIDRLDGEEGVWLRGAELERFPELTEAAVPAGFAFEPDEDGDSCLFARDGQLQVRLIGRLIPPCEVPDSDHSRLGALELDIDTESRQMLLGTLDLPEHAQQAGLGRIAIGQLAVLGDRLGLETIELQAGKIGRWAWLRCGFDFADDDAREIVVTIAANFADRLGIDVDLNRIKHSWDFIDLPGTVMPAEVLAAGGPAITPANAPVPVGKALLLGPPPVNPWFGKLTLDRRSEGRVRLDTYVLGDGLGATPETEG